MSTAILPASRVEEMVAVYAAKVADIRRAHELLDAAELGLGSAFYGPVDSYRQPSRMDVIAGGKYAHNHPHWGDPSDAIDRVRRSCWRSVVDHMEIRRALSMARAKELDDRLEKGELPELTADAIAEVVAFYSDASTLHAMAREAVKEVFDWLRPGDHLGVSKLKTNQRNARFELGPKIVLQWAVSSNWRGDGFHLDHGNHRECLALEKVFYMLDGRGDFGRASTPLIVAAIEASGREGRGETDLFRFRACKNRNLHIEFKRLDLVKRLNEIAGGMNLNPHRDDRMPKGAELVRMGA